MNRKELGINDVIFKKIAPVEKEYPILEMYEKGNNIPLLDIEIADDRSVIITFFKNKEHVGFDVKLYKKIYDKAIRFIEKEG